MDCSIPASSVLHCLPVWSNSCPLSQWCCLTMSTSAGPFSFCLQSFPASGSFPMSWFFMSVAKVLELQHQSFQWIFRVDFFRIDWFDLLAVQGTLKSLLQHHSFESISSLTPSLFHGPTFISVHDYWKTIALTIQTFVCKVMSLLFNMVSRFVIAFLPSSKHLLISWL